VEKLNTLVGHFEFYASPCTTIAMQEKEASGGEEREA